ncbi:MAG: hypothetical protein PHP46_03945 [Candidatus Omnitrophica bacterium]|nr:hypothetical protein [Candidatus Omnitrophota bacterium]
MKEKVMKYRTKIEIITEAEDKNEAVDLVGEYLSGNVITGIDMKCSTTPVQAYRKKVMTIALLGIVFVGTVFFSANIRPSYNSAHHIIGSNAVQPPLKTSIMEKHNSEFKKQWEAEQTRGALNSIKNNSAR